MIVAGTGHRPPKTGGYTQTAQNRLIALAVDSLKSLEPELELVITGMAQGWDTALALACCELGIPFHAYIPFEGQELLWPESAQKQYRELINGWADEKVICSKGGYSNKSMQIRNERMVDRADQNGQGLVLALWNGSSGGTSNCIDYAIRQKVSMINLWPFWMRSYRNLKYQ